MSKKIAVLIPCYNESKTIEKVINESEVKSPNDLSSNVFKL